MSNLSMCLVASIFVGASIYTMVTCETCQPFADYRESLDDELKALYDKVVAERRRIYFGGLILGAIIGFGYLYWLKGTMAHSCLFVGIVMGVQYLYYTLYPKTHSMLPNLRTKEQIDGWWAVYKTMKYRYHVGMVLGIVGYFFIPMALSN